MLLRSFLLIIVFVCSQIVRCDDFVWYNGKQAISYAMPQSTAPVVKIAFDMFAGDMKQVTGFSPKQSSASKATIRIIQLDKADKKVQKELRELNIPVDNIAAKKDGFYISVAGGSANKQLLIVGRTNNIPRGGEGSNYERAKYWHHYWGDDYGNRMDRFFIGAAYLDGIPQNGVKKANPSLIVTRGIYRNWQVWALDFNGSSLLPRWKFNTNDKGYESYRDMGSHTFRVADLNGDGYDEILYGSAAIARNGKGLYCTGNGHGDALHVGKFIPDRPGLQVVACFENPNKYINSGFGYGCAIFDAATGKFITGHAGGSGSGSGEDGADEEDEEDEDKDPPGDVGRCLVADIIPDSPGYEYWSSEASGVYSCQTGQLLSTTLPSAKTGSKSYNNAIFWTGDLTRQMLDDVMVHSYTKSAPWDKSRVVTFTYYGSGVYSNNSTKANPCYYGDFLGDYREEVIYRSKDGEYIYIFSSNHPTGHRFVHLMNDHTYDMSQAMQNVGYNQPTHLGYYIGADSK